MGESTLYASAKFSAWIRDDLNGVAITGASGWVGRAMAHVAVEAGARNLRLYGSREGSVEAAGRTLPVEALQSARPLGDGEWLVVHLAVAGADREVDPAALRALNDGLLSSAQRLAETGQVRRFVPASSGAVHLAETGPENKRAYARLKRDQELAGRDWAARRKVPLLIPRIFNLGGPYMNHAERYALGSFIAQARTGVIQIGAPRPVIRSYVHVLEFAAVTLDLALGDGGDLAFETAGTEAVEMAALASAVGEALGVPLDVRRPEMTSADEDRYVGDGAAYRAALAAMGRKPVGLPEIIRDTAAWLDA